MEEEEELMLFKVYFFYFKHRKKFLKKAVILKYFQKKIENIQILPTTHLEQQFMSDFGCLNIWEGKFNQTLHDLVYDHPQGLGWNYKIELKKKWLW